MPEPVALHEARMRELLTPYLSGEHSINTGMLFNLRRYLELLLHWNARANLTAVREPEAILQRQIGESLFAAHCVGESGTLLDFGSGAGFPGIPIAMMRPSLTVTLAESQTKKANFLREAARALNMPLKIWGRRVELLPAEQTFDYVTMRAVDDSKRMIALAADRVAPNGCLIRYLGESMPVDIPGWRIVESLPVPNSRGLLQITARG